MRFRRYAEYLVLQAMICFVQVIPLEWCDRMAHNLAWVLHDVVKFRKKIVYENITAVYPDLSDDEVGKMSRQMWYHLILLGCEVAQAPRKIHLTNWRKYVYIRDIEPMTRQLCDYRPMLAVSGHYGNFELAGYITGLFGHPSHTVARTLDNPFLDKFINDFRGLNGQFILPKNGSAPEVQKVLDAGGKLTLLGDQHAGTKGCWIEFMGRPASCHKAVALFTLTGNAPMMVSYCRHVGKPLHVEIGCTGFADPMDLPEELASVKKLTQWYNDRMADAINMEPSQYWWVHRRWKDKPVRQTAKVRRSAAA